MNNRLLSSLLATSMVFVAPALGSDAAKGRMRDRVHQIDQAKLAGHLGENNRGFVEVRQPGGKAAELAAAENADRQAVFVETAKKAGSTPEAVAKAFARQIAAASAPGVWLQRDDGTWHKK